MTGLAWLALAGCGPSVDCSRSDNVLAEVDGRSMTCEEGSDVVDWMEVLGGRPLPAAGDRELVLAEVARAFRADPDGTVALLGRIRDDGGTLANAVGLEGSVTRSHLVWVTDHGDGPIGPDRDKLWNLQKRALSVWTKDDGEQLAVTEADLEGWIRYASLCREAQRGGTLRISLSDRVTAYQTLIDRFDTADRPTQIAMASMGTVWPQVVDAWAIASFERQQAWIASAPLPPPMTASSLGYFEAVVQGDLVGHAGALQEWLGPFSVDPRGRFGVQARMILPKPVMPVDRPPPEVPIVP